MKQTNLIVLRGPSGSGKSTVAAKIRELFSEPTALIEQDYLRRKLLGEVAGRTFNNIELIEQTVNYCLERGYHVILEGILTKDKYEEMFLRIQKKHPECNFFFYFDVSFEETLRRHETKKVSDEFGEEEMRKWYKDDDRLAQTKETDVLENNTLEDTVGLIRKQVGI